MKRGAFVATIVTILLSTGYRINAQEQQVGFMTKTYQAPPASPGKPVPPDPSKGPTKHLTYKNDDGTFYLSVGNEIGTAVYKWHGPQRNKMKFVAYGEISDPTGTAVPKGQAVDVWLYDASDEVGDTIFFAFGINPLMGPGIPDGRYGLYRSRRDPRDKGATMQSWPTQSGTRRLP